MGGHASRDILLQRQATRSVPGCATPANEGMIERGVRQTAVVAVVTCRSASIALTVRADASTVSGTFPHHQLKAQIHLCLLHITVQQPEQ